MLVVEDIIDEGATLNTLVEFIQLYEPRSISVAALVEKPDREQVRPNVDARYVGFSIPNEFIVGHGFDYGERYRGLPHICTLAEDAKPDT